LRVNRYDRAWLAMAGFWTARQCGAGLWMSCRECRLCRQCHACRRSWPNGRGEAPVRGRCVRRVGDVARVGGGNRISPATSICSRRVGIVGGVGCVVRVMGDGEVGSVGGRAGRFATAFDVRMRAQTHAGSQAYTVACRTGKSPMAGMGGFATVRLCAPSYRKPTLTGPALWTIRRSVGQLAIADEISMLRHRRRSRPNLKPSFASSSTTFFRGPSPLFPFPSRHPGSNL
jgi:hypothetical protein